MAARSTPWIPVPLRVGVGTIMTVHGLGKLNLGPVANGTGVGGFAEFLATQGIPLPSLLALVVTLVELFGGLALLAGLFVRYAALLVAADMAIATLVVHLPNGFAVDDGGYEFTLLLLLVAITLVISGPGALSVERTLLDRDRGPIPFLPERFDRDDETT